MYFTLDFPLDNVFQFSAGWRDGAAGSALGLQPEGSTLPGFDCGALIFVEYP